jgi:glycerol uptake facilitator-like aquaporin
MAIDERTPSGIVTNVAIGLIVAIDIVWAGSISGGAMNPARWFGPALVSGNWSNSWVWIVGPLAGSAIATLAYEKMVKPKK